MRRSARCESPSACARLANSSEETCPHCAVLHRMIGYISSCVPMMKRVTSWFSENILPQRRAVSWTRTVVPRAFRTAYNLLPGKQHSIGRFGCIEYRVKFEIDDFSYGKTNPNRFRAILDRHRTTPNSPKIRTLALLPDRNGYDQPPCVSIVQDRDISVVFSYLKPRQRY